MSAFAHESAGESAGSSPLATGRMHTGSIRTENRRVGSDINVWMSRGGDTNGGLAFVWTPHHGAGARVSATRTASSKRAIWSRVPSTPTRSPALKRVSLSGLA